jgi:penicillin-binding protein 1A
VPLWKRRPTAARRRIRKLRLFAAIVVLGLLGSAAFTLGLVAAIASEIPALDPARQRAQELNGVIYANDGTSVLALLRGSESRVLVEPEEISDRMMAAIVAIEDRRFWEHRGVDVRGIMRALWSDIRQKRVVEGGSTITQQYVKNVYGEDTRTIGRKVREAALAWQLEQRWPKDRILTAYLNTIYFGNGAYGVQQASRAYFGKGARFLELHEASLLAGIPADPARYDPVTHPRAARERRQHVLGLMYEQGKITRAAYQRALRAELPSPEDVRLPGTRGPAAYFVNYVKDQLVEKYGAGRVFGGGLRVTTTIDLELQERARNAIEKVLRDPDGPAAALVAIEPETGAVRAMFGGRNFRESQFNLAAQAERQPGSAFKPIVLATALRSGISPATEVESRPISIDAGDRIWKVTNYDHSYLGRVGLDRAMVSSDNTVYAQLTDIVGPKEIVKTAHALGIKSRLDAYFSIGLGSEAVNPLEMARAYATIANGGRRVDGTLFGDRPRVVEQVERIRANRTEENRPRPTQVLGSGEAAVLTDILQDVVRLGTGRRAQVLGTRIAGKTGTTDHYADAWFVGYTPELAVAVWVGYPDRLRPMLTEFDGEPVTGGTLPALIWKEFVASLEDSEEDATFDPPPHLGGASTWVVQRDGEWQLDNGLCQGARLLVYFPEKEPSKTADCKPNEVRVSEVVGLTEAVAVARLAAERLEATVVYVPAKPGRTPGLVVNQVPRTGGLSAHDSVRLFVTTAPHGLVPNFVGSSLRAADREVRRLRLESRVVSAPGANGIVVEQSPEPGLAAAPGLNVRLVVGDGSRKGSS